ncbi:adenosylhomocysteinase [Flavobacterium procerum]|uniref:adenosylhomocysteinase n=1 Tax=Flavobacterium procerum TaxID=1455569 RepID=UPI0035E4A310
MRTTTSLTWLKRKNFLRAWGRKEIELAEAKSQFNGLRAKYDEKPIKRCRLRMFTHDVSNCCFYETLIALGRSLGLRNIFSTQDGSAAIAAAGISFILEKGS